MTPAPLVVRLAQRVERGSPEECWLWTGSVTRRGYGKIKEQGRVRGAHVVAWELANKRSAPLGMVVRHTCNVRACCNPAHLKLGTQADNIADMMRAGREARGERSGPARLTDSKVIEIRSRFASGESMKNLSQSFGVTTGTIWYVIRRRTWTHI